MSYKHHLPAAASHLLPTTPSCLQATRLIYQILFLKCCSLPRVRKGLTSHFLPAAGHRSYWQLGALKLLFAGRSQSSRQIACQCLPAPARACQHIRLPSRRGLPVKNPKPLLCSSPQNATANSALRRMPAQDSPGAQRETVAPEGVGLVSDIIVFS